MHYWSEKMLCETGIGRLTDAMVVCDVKYPGLVRFRQCFPIGVERPSETPCLCCA